MVLPPGSRMRQLTVYVLDSTMATAMVSADRAAEAEDDGADHADFRTAARHPDHLPLGGAQRKRALHVFLRRLHEDLTGDRRTIGSSITAEHDRGHQHDLP